MARGMVIESEKKLKGQFGRTAVMRSLGQREPLISVVIPEDQDARILTVVLKSVGQFPSGVVARVEFGNCGFQEETIMDFSNGVTFSVACSYLRVVAECAATPVAEFPVGAFVVEGVGEGTLQPTYTFAQVGPAAGANVVLMGIPKFAREIVYMTNRPNLDSFIVTFENSGGDYYGVEVLAGAGQTMPWTVVADIVDRIRVTNTGPNDIETGLAIARLRLA